jgi:hypothetical protein
MGVNLGFSNMQTKGQNVSLIDKQNKLASMQAGSTKSAWS